MLVKFDWLIIAQDIKIPIWGRFVHKTQFQPTSKMTSPSLSWSRVANTSCENSAESETSHEISETSIEVLVGY